VLVPALAADRRGVRLGYGKGFYDAFLPHTRALRVVPVFDACLAASLPSEAHDEPVHVVVTETQTLRISRGLLQTGS
jgi:5-formyltetrahydrofolate cyclo-ligase